MLFTFLDKTRTKSFAVRQRYAFGVAMTATLVIGGVWLVALPARFAKVTNVDATTEAASTAPFANMWNQLKAQFSTISLPKMPDVSTTSATSTTVDGTTTYDARLLLGTSTPSSTSLRPQPVAQEVLIETATTTGATSTGATSTSAD